mgnify:CR=1 FL=1
MINKVISTALKFYLRSQVKKIENLQLNITGSNRQILKGYIPGVFLTCGKGVYQGLHLSQIELTGSNIAFNVAEVVKQRKPLRLLEPVAVDIVVLLAAQDLQASLINSKELVEPSSLTDLTSSLLSDGLTDFLSNLLATNTINGSKLDFSRDRITWSKIALAEQQLNLRGTSIAPTGKTIELNITAGLTLADNHTLLLSSLKIETTPELPIDLEESLKIDLGTEVAISELSIQSDNIWCSGQITILP